MEKVENVTILIADDTPPNIKIIQKFLEPRGYDILIATNGQEAVDAYKAHEPDIILMDIMMPIMDGYQAAQEIKRLSAPKWVPLIFLSAKSTVEEQIEGINSGGDDYLTKPVDLRMLEAKLLAMLRIVEMQRNLNETRLELERYYTKAEEELVLAKSLMNNLIRNPSSNIPEYITSYNEAAESLSGDATVTAIDDEGRCYIMLADATGHGLTAAISHIPATQTFFAMVAKGYSVKSIARRINISLKRLLPPDRFVAATIVCIDFKSQLIELWNGSNPRPFFMTKKGEITRQFAESNFPLGIVDNKTFMSKMECFHWQEDGQLVLYSDGLIEVKNDKGEIFGFERLLEVASASASKPVPLDEQILAEVNAFKVVNKRFDDISLITVECKSQ